MARHLTREASNVLPALSLSSGDTAISRRIAADVAVIQIVGVLIARVICQDHAFSSL